MMADFLTGWAIGIAGGLLLLLIANGRRRGHSPQQTGRDIKQIVANLPRGPAPAAPQERSRLYQQLDDIDDNIRRLEQHRQQLVERLIELEDNQPTTRP